MYHYSSKTNKIERCTAKVGSCPYNENLHAETKEELLEVADNINQLKVEVEKQISSGAKNIHINNTERTVDSDVISGAGFMFISVPGSKSLTEDIVRDNITFIEYDEELAEKYITALSKCAIDYLESSQSSNQRMKEINKRSIRDVMNNRIISFNAIRDMLVTEDFEFVQKLDDYYTELYGRGDDHRLIEIIKDKERIVANHIKNKLNNGELTKLTKYIPAVRIHDKQYFVAGKTLEYVLTEYTGR